MCHKDFIDYISAIFLYCDFIVIVVDVDLCACVDLFFSLYHQ